ncbi:MAG: anti-sigma factor [Limisphaerales bacterium]
MIDERMEELACLYALGALEGNELREFEMALRGNPELQQFVAKLNKPVEALAGVIPMMEPPPQLRAKILAQVASPQEIVSLPERKFNPFSWLSWAFATCLAILCVVMFSQNSRLQKQVGNQANQIGELNQLAQSLQSATNNLQQTVFALQETNRLANLKIAMLNSLVTTEPKAVAVSLWDNEKQNGVFVAENLKALPADRDYELWVMDENEKPVAAGVFHTGENGVIRINFKPIHSVQAANKFAVTEEVKGGVLSPTLKNLVLASN